MTAAYELHRDVVWVAGPSRSTRIVHLGGVTCVLSAAQSRMLGELVGVPAPMNGVALEDAGLEADETLVPTLLGLRIIRTADGRPAIAEHARAVLARRLLGVALTLCDAACAERRGARPLAAARGLMYAARWGIAAFGWAETVRAFERRYPPPAHAAEAPADLFAEIDDRVRRAAARSLIGARCKERALAALALTRRAGLRGELVLGMSDFPLKTHVWVQCDGTIVSDDPRHCAAFRPVAPAPPAAAGAGPCST